MTVPAEAITAAACADCSHDPGDPRVRVICECPCHGLTSPHPEEGTTGAATA